MMGGSRGRGSGVQLDEAIEEAKRSPFVFEIQYAKLPPKCTLPAFTSIFEGTGNVVHHIKCYTLSLLQWEINDEVLCKYFPGSLRGDALKWFDALPEASISSFSQIQRTFPKPI